MPVESRHFLLNAHVAGRVLVLRQIAESLIEGRIVKEKDPRAVFHLVLGLDYQLDKIHYRVSGNLG
jgi:hypothetical protein